MDSPIGDLLNLRSLFRNNLRLAHHILVHPPTSRISQLRHDAALIISWLDRALPHLESTLVRAHRAGPLLLNPYLSAFKMDIDAAAFRLNIALAEMTALTSPESPQIHSSTQHADESPTLPDYLHLDDVEALAAAAFKDVIHCSHRAKLLCRKEHVRLDDRARRVLVCCAGDDIEHVGLVLFDMLKDRGLNACLEGYSATGRVFKGDIHHNHSPLVGVFILSDEFSPHEGPVARLMRFQQAQNDTTLNDIGVPILLPVFYNFGTQCDCCECASNCIENETSDEDFSSQQIAQCLQGLSRMAGIENYEGACNGEGAEAAQRRRRLVEMIADSVEEICGD